MAGPTPQKKRSGKRSLDLHSTPRYWGVLGLICLACLAAFLYDEYSTRKWEARMDNSVRRTETALELSVAARMLRQYRVVHGNLPTHSIDYLSQHLKRNKPYPAGCDFWGTPYLLDMGSDGHLLRSAGPNRKMGDSDDLLVSLR